MRKLNLDQRRFLSDFLNGLSIAWFSVGIISPLFIKVENTSRLIIQIGTSLSASVILILLGLKILKINNDEY